MGQIQNLEDLLDFLRRRRNLILAITVIGTVLAAVFAKTRPDTFEATAAIQVQGAQVGAAPGTQPAGSSVQLLQSIEQRLTTREGMLDMIERHGLYTQLPLTPEEKVNVLRNSIQFQGIEAAGGQGFGQPSQLSAILISARTDRAETAAAVANDFAQRVLEISSARSLGRAQETLAFFRDEEARMGTAIAEIESQIAIYKNTHAGALGSAISARRDELVEIENELRRIDTDMVAMQDQLRRLEDRLDELRVTEQRQLRDLQTRIGVISEQRATLVNRRDEIQGVIDAQPEAERGLSGLERELEQLQGNLNAAAARRAEAETTLRLAERDQSERLALLDEAVVPLYPTGSSGRKLFAAGAFASLIAALGLGFLLDLMRPVVRTSTQMERQLGLRPVITIPELDFGRAARSLRPAASGRAGSAGVRSESRSRVTATPLVVFLACGLTLALLAVALVTR